MNNTAVNTTEHTQKIGLSSNTLKFMMAFLMVLDHCYFYLENMPVMFTYLGRIVAPIFFFLSVEGFFKTHSRTSYILRMYIFAAAMAFGNFLFNNSVGLMQKISNNMFLSLAVGLTIMYVLEYIKQNNRYRTYLIALPAIIFLSTFMLFTEASLYGLMMVFIFYFCYGKKLKTAIFYIIGSLILTIGLIFEPLSWQTLLNEPQWMMVFAIIPILLYNGKKGHGGKMLQYGFYVFYPLHIWIIYFLKYVIR